ncbi:hypothetical protein Y694_04290 [Methylibium sp. T29-B]|nr:hypothetical protein Y694_04290 [Methylibium sp. T29-B]
MRNHVDREDAVVRQRGQQRADQAVRVVDRAAGEAAVLPGQQRAARSERGEVAWPFCVSRPGVAGAGPQRTEAALGGRRGAVQEQQHAVLRVAQRQAAGGLPAAVDPAQQHATRIAQRVVQAGVLERRAQLRGEREVGRGVAWEPARDAAAEDRTEVVELVEAGRVGQLAHRVALDRGAGRAAARAGARAARQVERQLDGRCAVRDTALCGRLPAVAGSELDRVGVEHRAVGEAHLQHGARLAQLHGVEPARRRAGAAALLALHAGAVGQMGVAPQIEAAFAVGGNRGGATAPGGGLAGHGVSRERVNRASCADVASAAQPVNPAKPRTGGGPRAAPVTFAP